MQEKTFLVPNITCHHCVMAIKNELTDLPGVEKVEADVDSKQVRVAWEEPATWDKISTALEEIGYPAAL